MGSWYLFHCCLKISYANTLPKRSLIKMVSVSPKTPFTCPKECYTLPLYQHFPSPPKTENPKKSFSLMEE